MANHRPMVCRTYGVSDRRMVSHFSIQQKSCCRVGLPIINVFELTMQSRLYLFVNMQVFKLMIIIHVFL